MTTEDILGITVIILALFFFGERVFEYVKEQLK